MATLSNFIIYIILQTCRLTAKINPLSFQIIFNNSVCFSSVNFFLILSHELCDWELIFKDFHN